MKSKIHKIMGVVITLVLLLSLLVFAAPAAAATLAWTTVTTPNPTYKQLAADDDVDALVIAKDGNTIFAFSNNTYTLYKSTNAGVTWSTTNIGDGLEATKVVAEDAEDAWNEQNIGNVTSSLETADRLVGSGSAKIDIAAGFTTGIVASEAITAASLTATTQIALWIKSSVATAAGDLQLLLDDSVNVGSPQESLNIPALTAATWTKVNLPIGTPANLTAVISVGLKVITDLGAQTVYIDNVVAASTYDVAGLAISPGYATDSALVAATANKVFRSTNGGASFGEVSTALLTTASGADGVDVFITSIAYIDVYYTGGAPAILVGTRDTDADQGGGVFLCRLDTWTWTDLDVNGADGGTGAGGVADVYAVAFSPNHRTDAQVMAVAVGATTAGTADYNDKTYYSVKAAGNAWAADVLTATIPATTVGAITEAQLTRAAIAFPSDYEWSTNNKVFVGTTSGSTTLDDVYRVAGALPGSASSATDLEVGGSTTETNVYSLAVSGTYVGASVLVGQTGSTTVKRTSDPSVSTVTWSSSVKGPIGGTPPNTIVVMAPDFATSKKVYVGTGGANSSLSVSTDGGVYFNGLALIDISAGTKLRYLDSAIVDANTMFLLIHDDADGGADFDAAEPQHLFKTTDGGATWQRVTFVKPSGTTDVMTIVRASPKYATDATVYVAQNDTRLWKSTDGGIRFVGLAAPGNIRALAVVDSATYFTGHDDGKVYKSGLWNYGTAAGAIKSIALSPSFATDDTVLVGNDDGDVYLSKNASATASVVYTRQGIDDELGNGATVTVAFDLGYATNSTIYAVSSDATTIGIMRWVAGTSLTWAEIDGTATSGELYASLNGSGVVLSADGTLYAGINVADKGIRRSLAPTSATVAGRGFESMKTSLPAGAKLLNLAYLPGSNVLYAVVSNITSPATSYPHGYSILTITDTFAITPVLLAPADGATTVGTSLDLSWTAITAPSGTTVTYTYDVAYDSAFANKVVNAATTTGTTVKVTGLTPGTGYYWRVYVAAASPLTTRKASRTFVVMLGTATQSTILGYPSPGASGVPIKPSFQWEPVAGATSYHLEVADNPAFRPVIVSKVLDTTVWAKTVDLKYSTVYYWRVKALSATTEGAWSMGIFTTAAAPVPPAPPAPPAPPPVTITQVPPPQITVTVPAPVIPPAPAPITPAWIYAIIIIGAVLVIAVIVLIVRTRRVA